MAACCVDVPGVARGARAAPAALARRSDGGDAARLRIDDVVHLLIGSLVPEVLLPPNTEAAQSPSHVRL